MAVLDGVLAGRVWADDRARPTVALVIEDSDGTVFGGGSLTASQVADTLADVETASGDLIFGFADGDDALRGMLPREPYWTGEAIDFTDRRPPPDEPAGPEPPLEGMEVVALDASTLP